MERIYFEKKDYEFNVVLRGKKNIIVRLVEEDGNVFLYHGNKKVNLPPSPWADMSAYEYYWRSLYMISSCSKNKKLREQVVQHIPEFFKIWQEELKKLPAK
jgi:hypothetical protein